MIGYPTVYMFVCYKNIINNNSLNKYNHIKYQNIYIYTHIYMNYIFEKLL